ncbi:MAG TPA: peptidoglycan DD-metalloendopeptidase family protein [Flavobacterium sp.]|nr:peptidoglycan DD-metalloendopeptidase family protein [Flavobacterium sp.]
MDKQLYIFMCFVFLALFSCGKDKQDLQTNTSTNDSLDQIDEREIFGFQLRNFKVERDTINRGDNLSLILARHNFDATDIHEIVQNVKDSFDVRKIKAGKTFTLLKKKEAPHDVELLIYEPDNLSFSVIDLRDSIVAYNVKYPITYKTKVVAGEINGSLSESIANEGVDSGIANMLAKNFAWSIDFFKFQRGDKFALYVTEKYINDSIYAGVEKLHGAYFNYKGKDVYGFPYKSKDRKGIEFFDEEGKQMRTMFLKSPLKYFRITSKFSKRRFHPVQKRYKAHNGTDYAAPHGTPIMTTASGVVIETGYTSANGNYVKVKHNATYTTQYLHMSKILVKRGQRVEQGQTIGRVGSTGLATGPHVCYRFWKNGVQVDPLRQNLPTSMPLNASELPIYLKEIQPIKDSLDQKLLEKF